MKDIRAAHGADPRQALGADHHPGGEAHQIIHQVGRQQRGAQRAAAFAEHRVSPAAPSPSSIAPISTCRPASAQGMSRAPSASHAAPAPHPHPAHGTATPAPRAALRASCPPVGKSSRRDTTTRTGCCRHAKPRTVSTGHRHAPCPRPPSPRHGARAWPCTARRASGPVIHWLCPVAVAMRPSSELASFRVSKGAPLRGAGSPR
jgi:hypothetical protein